MVKIKEMVETLSPILVKPTTSSITFSLSKRFILFNLMNKIVHTIEEDPYLNFISLLKNYKILGTFLYGTVHEFYRDRNKSYFKNFFFDKSLYNVIKDDLEWLAKDHGQLRVTITKRGVIIYDNYKTNSFNVLLMTIHAGTWVPEIIDKKLSINAEFRLVEEDIDTHRIYSNLVLMKGGIWIDNKQSRFVCDFNRGLDKAIYADNSEEWIDVIWKEKLTKREEHEILSSYHEFYFTLARLAESYHFNIIFDGHSMKSIAGRPSISFGTNFIPKFYMPIVIKMQQRLHTLGYSPVLFNTPYMGGYILEWFSRKFPHLFIFSMEINKKLYMTDDMKKSVDTKIKKIAEDITKIFDIEIDANGTDKPAI